MPRASESTIGEEIERLQEVRQLLLEIKPGATAIGTRVTAAPGYREPATRYLAELTGQKFILAGDLVVEEQTLLDPDKWDEIFSFENLINPQFAG